jgi:hypothetical protein
LNFGWPILEGFSRVGAMIKAQTIEGPVGASPACCHSERSEESLCGFAYSKDRDREILRFAQNDTQGGGRHSAGEAGFNRL